MARVLGIGGVFFKSRDPKSLGEWYREWLGIPVDPEWGGFGFPPGDVPEHGLTVWSPFDSGTTYFDPSVQPFMVNLMVDDLDGALAQVARGGAEIVGNVEEFEYGRFGWFLDPDGNKVELWEPAG
jgi:catechol 2,3-dioxygenase-like lactoylglutathione lyase family enzyme